jgi:hypothetical protein
MKDCEKQDYKIQGVLDVLQSQREAINSIIESANAMQFEYKDAVDRIGYRAKEQMSQMSENESKLKPVAPKF